MNVAPYDNVRQITASKRFPGCQSPAQNNPAAFLGTSIDATVTMPVPLSVT